MFQTFVTFKNKKYYLMEKTTTESDFDDSLYYIWNIVGLKRLLKLPKCLQVQHSRNWSSSIITKVCSWFYQFLFTLTPPDHPSPKKFYIRKLQNNFYSIKSQFADVNFSYFRVYLNTWRQIISVEHWIRAKLYTFQWHTWISSCKLVYALRSSGKMAEVLWEHTCVVTFSCNTSKFLPKNMLT